MEDILKLAADCGMTKEQGEKTTGKMPFRWLCVENVHARRSIAERQMLAMLFLFPAIIIGH